MLSRIKNEINCEVLQHRKNSGMSFAFLVPLLSVMVLLDCITAY